VVAVPLVLKRLMAKDEEWRDAQANFNKVRVHCMREWLMLDGSLVDDADADGDMLLL
jgi:hypothetical protein